ncbi:hypothetical protein HS048_08620 [Planomonospora sp. ID91781]|uniref:DUF4190 domain-containing protein n=1 Tax=Planomonospora sphaerica TaxID=161355 RepID=A0A171CDB9_9ACTN|nr:MULTISPECIES: hypothetical protein [Planomonospora]MBG0820795.1 hypothetical protein [Planomonospora sp. ID91781]GAT66537.1 hypothetical protein PS9374_02187 [Planomonospora sphaerica]
MATPVQLRPAESAGRRALWLAFASAVMTLMLPMAGLVMSIFALVVSIRAIPALRSVSKPIGTAVAGIAIASAALLFSIMASAFQFYLRDELSAYEECRRGASTVTAQDECLNRLEDSMRKKLPFVEPGQLRFPFGP